MKKLVTIVLILISVAAIGYRYFKNSKHQVYQNKESQIKTEVPPPPLSPTPTPIPPPSSQVKTYTMAEVAQHVADEENYVCWTVIHDKVYDITEYMNHPGGEQIYRICGKDGTALFENRPGKGTPHPDSARKILEKYYIGDLQK